MSLIIAIRSAEGVVLAASGPDTMPSSNGLPGARQLERKLRAVGGGVLGVVGHDGLAQEMSLALQRYLRNGSPEQADESELRGGIREAVATPIRRTVAIHRTLEGLTGFGSASAGYVLSHSVLAMPLGGSLKLFALDPECSMTEISEETGFVAVGRGAALAEPFLRFLRKLLWPAGLPQSNQAELAAYWAIHHCIESSPGTLAGPIQLMLVRHSADAGLEVRERSDGEKAQLYGAVEEAEETMRRSLRFPSPSNQATSRATGSGNSRPQRKRVPEVRFTLGSPDRQAASRERPTIG